MDKFTLNQQIVLCRGSVKKAKLFLINKTVKNLRLLEKCNSPDEAVRAKKKRKAERLQNELKLLKEIKPDKVTKFALRNNDLKSFIQAVADAEDHVLAKLADHKEVKLKIENIKLKVQDYENELPRLLDELGKNKKKNNKGKANTTKPVNLPNSHEAAGKTKTKNDLSVNSKNVEKRKSNSFEETVIKSKKQKQSSKIKKSLKKPVKQPSDLSEQQESNSSDEEPPQLVKTQEPQPVEKVYDSFFIDKKVFATPLTELETEEDDFEYKKEFRDRGKSKIFEGKKYEKLKSKSFKVEEKRDKVELHPSWQAAMKKHPSILPFLGKKIQFD